MFFDMMAYIYKWLLRLLVRAGYQFHRFNVIAKMEMFLADIEPYLLMVGVVLVEKKIIIS